MIAASLLALILLVLVFGPQDGCAIAFVVLAVFALLALAVFAFLVVLVIALA